MSGDGPLGDVMVTGGVTGLAVQVEDLVRTGTVLSDVGLELAAVAASAGTVLLDLPGPCALLDAGGAARATAAVLDAVAGPSGVGGAAVALELRAGQLVLAAARYAAADRLEGELRDLRHWVQGSVAVAALPAVLLVGGAWWVTTSASGGDPLEEAEDWLADHPGAVDELAGGAPALVSGLVGGLAGGLLGPVTGPADAAVRAVTGRTLLPRSLAEAAALVGLAYPPAEPEVTLLGTGSASAPGGVGPLVAGLAATSGAARGQRQGAVVIRRLVSRGPDGSSSVSYVVDLPGTKDWQPDPRERPYVNDLASSLELMAGEPSVRVEAVREVLRQAGVQAHDPVMLVGHSQGGLVAVAAAAALQDDYRVSHVVTVGSPTGRMAVPAGVQVLSLENRDDVVPRLDAAPNPDRTGHVTVAFDGSGEGLVEAHDLAGYRSAAAALDRQDHPAVREWLRTADAFVLDAAEDRSGHTVEVRTSTFVVRNGAPP
jgi:hypothetical protein